jgi:hypothetical protein
VDWDGIQNWPGQITHGPWHMDGQSRSGKISVP